MTTYDYFKDITDTTPFHLTLLSRRNEEEGLEEPGLSDMMEQIEVLVFNYVRAVLRDQYGDRWWSHGVPETVRTQCAVRREQERTSEIAPVEAYLNLIDLKEIALKNWSLLSDAFESVSGSQGKARGASWLDELNEVRKQWAHPIKKMFFPLQPQANALVARHYKNVLQSFRLSEVEER